VIEKRVGIPISLAVIYIIVARRAGLNVEGINLPGHFIARYHGTLFDPFHQGRILSMVDCEAILARQNVQAQAHYFSATSSRLIFARMLANLVFIFERNGDDAMHKQVLTWLRALEGSR
jgi:regulator of sirC expression with transglutaminase-like and TPR domain